MRDSRYLFNFISTFSKKNVSGSEYGNDRITTTMDMYGIISIDEMQEVVAGKLGD